MKLKTCSQVNNSDYTQTTRRHMPKYRSVNVFRRHNLDTRLSICSYPASHVTCHIHLLAISTELSIKHNTNIILNTLMGVASVFLTQYCAGG
jgi:hypothetical protein